MQETINVSWFFIGVLVVSSFFVRFLWEVAGVLSRKVLNQEVFDCRTCKVWERINKIEERQQILRETRIPRIEESLATLTTKIDILTEKIDRLYLILERGISDNR